MRTSPRPGGVPDQLETDAVAAAVADMLWTLDGQAWPALVIGGSCGSTDCTLEVSGTPAGAAVPDLYVFSVAPESASVQLVDASLRGLSGDLGQQLDAMARTVAPSELQGMLLVSARWLPPPDEGTFVLAYRTGGEEGSCGLDVTLDAAVGVIVDKASRDC
ncbi:MAG: hypothetical protein ACRDGJ_03020 [Candidatus Limnocylindria bacterium]